MKKKILKITLSIVLILILAAGIGLTYLVGAAGGGGPFDFVWKNKLKKMAGNAEKYSLKPYINGKREITTVIMERTNNALRTPFFFNENNESKKMATVSVAVISGAKFA